MTKPAKPFGAGQGVPFGLRLKLWSRRVLPALTWAAVLVGVLFLLQVRIVLHDVVGFASEVQVEVSPQETGRLTALMVRPFQQVTAGEPVATLDDLAVRIELDASLLDIDRLQAELTAARARLEMQNTDRKADLLGLRRRLELDQSQALTERIGEEGRLERDQASLLGLAAELKRIAELAGDIVSQRRFDDIRAEHDSLANRIEGRRQTIEALKQAEAGALERGQMIGQELGRSLTDDQLEPLVQAIKVAVERVRDIRRRIEARVLRAPVTGRVDQILRRPGEVIRLGDPVLSLVVEQTTEVVAYLKESQMEQVRPGDLVEVRRRRELSQSAEGEVVHLGPAVAELPVQLRVDPSRPEFGRPMLVRVPSSFKLIPGEPVDLMLLPR